MHQFKERACTQVQCFPCRTASGKGTLQSSRGAWCSAELTLSELHNVLLAVAQHPDDDALAAGHQVILHIQLHTHCRRGPCLEQFPCDKLRNVSSEACGKILVEHIEQLCEGSLSCSSI